MQALLRNVDRWLFEEYRTSLEDLAIFRILFASYVLIGTLPIGLWLHDLPQASFSPPISLAALFRDYPPYWVIYALNLATIFFTFTLLIGWRTAYSSFGVCIGTVLTQSFCYADGKIDHDILIAIVPLMLARSGWGDHYSFDAGHVERKDASAAERQPWLSAILALLIACAVFTAGLAKYHGGWLSLHSLAIRWQLLPNFCLVERTTGVGAWAMRTLQPWAWKSMDISTVLWEMSFVLAVPRRSWFRFYCAFGALFHMGVWQMFGIGFAPNAVAYGAFLPWSRLAQSTPARLRRWLVEHARLLALIPLALILAKLFVLGPDAIEQMEGLMEGTALIAAFVVALCYLAWLIARSFGFLRQRAPRTVG
jgi:hypothetical protein